MSIAGMKKPELYNESNSEQRRVTQNYLKEYAHKIKWNKMGDTAIDIGCGDGSVSVIVKNLSPYNYKKFVGCDISDSMVKFANQRYGSEDITFRVLDIGDELPEDLKGAFNHVFSFFALHWVKDQEKAFRNIFNLLTEKGDFFINFIGGTAIYSVYIVLAQHDKWKNWLKRVDLFVSPYHNTKHPEKKVHEILEKVGFKDIDVSCKHLKSSFDNIEGLKNIIQSVEPFNMPQDVFEDFFQDYLTVGQEIGALTINKNEKNEIVHVEYDYSLLVMCAHK